MHELDRNEISVVSAHKFKFVFHRSLRTLTCAWLGQLKPVGTERSLHQGY